VPKDFSVRKEYEKGFSLTDLFFASNSGVKTDRDSLFIDFCKKSLSRKIKLLLSGKFDDNFKSTFNIKNSTSYKLLDMIRGKQFDDSFIQKIEYRPFDRRWIYYNPALISRPAAKVMMHFVDKENIGLILRRTVENTKKWQQVHLSSYISDVNCLSAQTYNFPLYLYSDDNALVPNEQTRKPNLNADIIKQISKKLKLKFVEEKKDNKTTFAPIDVLDYIYAILHSPSYRERYNEFLKIDFPRVPYPENAESFWKLVNYGGKLRRLHLMEDLEPSQDMATYPIAGSNIIENITYKANKVYINDNQYFDNVPTSAWDFYIGGYQPAQKWLKDRKGRVLEYDDIVHYQKIVCALVETERVMNEIG
jgi:predicted helicase